MIKYKKPQHQSHKCWQKKNQKKISITIQNILKNDLFRSGKYLIIQLIYITS